MSEVTTEAQQAGSAATEEAKTFDAEYVGKLRAEAAKYRTEAKANSDAAARLAEIEEANKTEMQKAIERAEAAEKSLAETAAANDRLAVIATHGIPEEFHDLVQGADKDALEASAKKIASLIATSAEPSKKSRVVIPGEGSSAPLPLNGDGLEQAIRETLNIK